MASTRLKSYNCCLFSPFSMKLKVSTKSLNIFGLQLDNGLDMPVIGTIGPFSGPSN